MFGRWRGRTIARAIGAAVVGLAVAAPALAAVVVVNPADLQGWGFVNEGAAGKSGGALVAGPSNPPAGDGSLRLTVADGTGGIIFAAAKHQNVALRDIDALQYSTFVTGNGGGVQAIALQLNVDYDLNDGNAGWQGRLVYEPYQNGAVQQGVWQTWNAGSDGARWWATGAPGNASCPHTSPCTLSQIRALFPNAGIHASLGGIGLKAGSGWPSFDGNADALTITIDGVTTVYDFEASPATADQCKKDGWKAFKNADGSPTFKNQGDCVSSVASKNT